MVASELLTIPLILSMDSMLCKYYLFLIHKQSALSRDAETPTPNSLYYYYHCYLCYVNRVSKSAPTVHAHAVVAKPVVKHIVPAVHKTVYAHADPLGK